MAFVYVYLRADRPKNGLVPVQIKVEEKGKKPYYHKISNVMVDASMWDAKSFSVSSEHFNATLINRKIKSEKLKIESMLLQMDSAGIPYSKEYLDKKMNGYDEHNVYDFWQNVIDNRRGTITDGTIATYQADLNKTKEFAPVLYFGDVTLDFLERYEAWMRKTKKNKPNSIGKTMKKFNYIIDRANESLGLKINAFEKYKKPYEYVHRNSFEMSTIDKLLELLYSERLQKKYHDTLAIFCLQCLTGLRFSDAVRFNKDEFVIRGNIIVNTEKTGEPVYIPIIGRLKELLEYQDYKFHHMELQTANDRLKFIGKEVKLPFSLSTHIGVHSFCVTALDLGIPLEVISKIRGHQDLRTTQIYAKVKNNLIEREMQKWDTPRTVLK